MSKANAHNMGCQNDLSKNFWEEFSMEGELAMELEGSQVTTQGWVPPNGPSAIYNI